MQIGELKGVGEKTEALFHKLNIYSVEDLLQDYPVHYLEFTPPVAVSSVKDGETAAVEGVITGRPAVRKGRAMTIVTAKISDPSGALNLIWYNAPYIASKLRYGSRFVFHGRIASRGNTKYMEHPEVYTLSDYDREMAHLRPVYGLTKGLRNKTVIRTMQAALEYCRLMEDFLPDSVRKILGLIPEEEAVREIHFPESKESLANARRRLVFDELLLFILAVRTLKEQNTEHPNDFPMKKTWDTELLIEKLPYRLTRAQRSAWQVIEEELAGNKMMNRLIQGDVGSGKTILAFLAMQMTASNGYQSVLMAPTEVLASQHYEKLCAMKESMGLSNLSPVLLIGSMRAKEKREAREKIGSGEANCIIGTQALIQESVSYAQLALVITDEQHRFGVRQRKALSEGETMPNLMVMSATPIPRTLGIIFYGDLDVTVLDEKPNMQLPIKNALVDRSWRPNAYRFIKKQIEAGRQAYIICAMVEPSEELDVENVTEYVRKVRKEIPDCRIEALHGQMKSSEKEKVMTAFARGEIQILVATTVVEVGVDVPNATVMMIEDAERFGLAALHQLRGRVGRGEYQSYCIFMAGTSNEEAQKRLSVLSSTNDGFEIAEKDFELRGPGDLLGVRQSGDLYFSLSDPVRDREVMTMAGQLAADIISDNVLFASEEYRKLSDKLANYLKKMEGNLIL